MPRRFRGTRPRSSRPELPVPVRFQLGSRWLSSVPAGYRRFLLGSAGYRLWLSSGSRPEQAASSGTEPGRSDQPRSPVAMRPCPCNSVAALPTASLRIPTRLANYSRFAASPSANVRRMRASSVQLQFRAIDGSGVCVPSIGRTGRLLHRIRLREHERGNRQEHRSTAQADSRRRLNLQEESDTRVWPGVRWVGRRGSGSGTRRANPHPRPALRDVPPSAARAVTQPVVRRRTRPAGR